MYINLYKSAPSSSVVTFTTELPSLMPTMFLANTLKLYFVEGERFSKEALVLNTTQELFEFDP